MGRKIRIFSLGRKNNILIYKYIFFFFFKKEYIKEVLPSGFSDAANATYNAKTMYNHFMVLSAQSSHRVDATYG